MCCPLCEEPVRSVLIGLAAVGVVSIVRTVHKGVKRLASRDDGLESVSAPAETTPDSAS